MVLRPVYTERKLELRGKVGDFSRFAVLIESGFPCEDRNLFCIKIQSFTNVNYYNLRIINYKNGVAAQSWATAPATLTEKRAMKKDEE